MTSRDVTQAILESEDQQMALNDIYNWFRNKSAYFKSNSATWKVVLVAVDHDGMVMFVELS